MILDESEAVVNGSILEESMEIILVRVQSDVRVRVDFVSLIELTEESEEFGAFIVSVDCNAKESVLGLDTVVVHEECFGLILLCIQGVLDVVDDEIAESESVCFLHGDYGKGI